MVHTVELQYFPPKDHHAKTKQLCWDVWFEGKVIVDASTSPEFHAAKYLHENGYSGEMQTIDFITKKPRMIFQSIEKYATKSDKYKADKGQVTRPVS